MMSKRKICVVTAIRSEYGQLSRIIKLLAEDPAIELQLLVSGAHLEEKFGMSVREIEADGFRITEKIKINIISDSPESIADSSAETISKFSRAFIKYKPDITVILGDRYEILSVATAAMLCGIPIAHLGGGAVTEGVIDDAMRHSITKMASLHFPGAEEERKRIIQLGENPERVFNFGEPAVDVIKHTKLLKKNELETKLGRPLAKRNLMITFHPLTLARPGESLRQFNNILAALDELKDTLLIFTKPNADAESAALTDSLDAYAAAHPEKTLAFTSMGRVNYLSALQFVDAVVGNSSSGLAEAPTFKIGTINIGDRQTGRIKASSVIDCDPETDSVRKALTKLYSAEFQTNLKDCVNPYGSGGASEKICKVLKSFPLTNITRKKFFDVKFTVSEEYKD